MFSKIKKIFWIPFLGFIILIPVLSAGDDHDAGTEKIDEVLKDSITIESHIVQLKSFLQRNPLRVRERILLGHLYLEQDKPAAAEQEFEIARKVGADPREILPLLGYSLLAQGNALGLLERIKPPNPVPSYLRAQIALLYGQAQLMLEQFNAAVASFNEALKWGGVSNAARIGLAWTALAENDFERAEAEVTQAFAGDPRSADVWLVKAEILRLRAKPDEARDAFANVLALEPRNLSARLGKAAMELAQHQTDLAAKDLRVASQMAPRHPLVNRLNVLLAAERGNPGLEEILNFLTSVDQEKSSPTFLFALGKLMAREIKTGHHQAILFAARRLQNQAPKLALGYSMEGAVRMIQQDWDGAARALDSAYWREPSGLLAVDFYIARMNSGKEGAETILENWFSTHPDDLETRLAAAIAFQRKEQFYMAQTYYEKILKVQPNHFVALNNLAWLYFIKHDPRAIAFAERAYQITPNNSQVLDTYHQILLSKNNLQRAIIPLR
ncbi:hypothetical protein CCP3SC5AM1_140006 [Gammaproteobacteria bacterium]